ncbi:RNA polymerase sigma factor [Erythrobacter sp. YT30]|uniref:RNA polymerase sigma factor n=1 Tax=Erythrobacter sp. YT30 TaxID=1735012 RepID=UPI00076DC444|nr:RNA polymerase sigma factor [Erythrobacter sp. YT30]KWV92239.1 hypothetical protein AUC45_06940 [Erythrobacter sp. YT30]
MTTDQDRNPLEQAFLDQREILMRFLSARGAGNEAEDLLQELWLKIQRTTPKDVQSPHSYLMRAANHLMIDRHRSRTQAESRDHAWLELVAGVTSETEPTPLHDRNILARQQLEIVENELRALGERPYAIFRRHRVDEVPQRAIAEEFGISLSTVESDLRRCYAVLATLRERLNEA